jgi:hypothetical protein
MRMNRSRGVISQRTLASRFLAFDQSCHMPESMTAVSPLMKNAGLSIALHGQLTLENSKLLDKGGMPRVLP